MTLTSDILHATKALGRSSDVVSTCRLRVQADPDAYRAAVVEVVLEGTFDAEQGASMLRLIEAIVAGEDP